MTGLSLSSKMLWQAEKLKRSLEAELLSLREKVSELENESSLKSEEVASAAAGKEEALSSALTEIRSLKEANSAKAWVSPAACCFLKFTILFGASFFFFFLELQVSNCDNGDPDLFFERRLGEGTSAMVFCSG